jgi:hypothetical protein
MADVTEGVTQQVQQGLACTKALRKVYLLPHLVLTA